MSNNILYTEEDCEWWNKQVERVHTHYKASKKYAVNRAQRRNEIDEALKLGKIFIIPIEIKFEIL